MRPTILTTTAVLVALSGWGAAALPAAQAESRPTGQRAVVPTLVDRATAAGLAQSTRSWSTSAADFNNDGFEDVLTEFHQYGDSWVYSNDRDGTFTRAFRIARRNAQGGVLDRHDCQWYDVDGNGLADFYCSGGRNESNYVKNATNDNELWLQLTPGQFTDRGTEWGVGDPCGRGRIVLWIDVNNDGWKDLFVGNQEGRNVTDPCDNPANGYLPEDAKVFLNNGGTGLSYSAQWSGFKPNIGVRCAVAVDYNRDGRMDLVSCAFRNNRGTVYRNTGSGWADVTSTINPGNLADAVAADLNRDGIADLVTADVNGATYRRGTGTTFAPAVRIYQTPSNADGFDLAIGDIQGDGLDDIYLVTDSTNTSTNPTDRLFVNHGGFSFTAVTPPGAGGMGDSAVAVDVNGTGKDQFVVLNGADSAVGPVQLIAAAP